MCWLSEPWTWNVIATPKAVCNIGLNRNISIPTANWHIISSSQIMWHVTQSSSVDFMVWDDANVVYKWCCMQDMYISEILLYISHSNLMEGNISLATRDVHSLFDRSLVTIIWPLLIGHPKAVISPVGPGIRLSKDDQVEYKFPLSKPWPCPFYIKQCSTGITLSFWFRWSYVVTTYQKWYVSLGQCFYLYRADSIKNNLIALRWNDDREKANSWYGGLAATPRKWTHITWVVNHTYAFWYRDGMIGKSRPKKKSPNLRCGVGKKLKLNAKLNKGDFSLGPIQLWAGRKSPMLIWILFQEGLSDYSENWLSICNNIQTAYRLIGMSALHKTMAFAFNITFLADLKYPKRQPSLEAILVLYIALVMLEPASA